MRDYRLFRSPATLEPAIRLCKTPSNMKTLSLLLLLAIGTLTTLTSCGRGGPATRAGRAIDTGVYKAGYGIQRAGQSISNAAR